MENETEKKDWNKINRALVSCGTTSSGLINSEMKSGFE